MYKNILLAIDLSEEAEVIVSRAMSLFGSEDVKFFIAHIVEPVIIDTGFELTPTIDFDIEKSLIERSNNFISQLLTKLSIPTAGVIVTLGNTKHEIHRICETEKIELVIMGTHGRHGAAMLLGSTTNAVLHGTQCDVLAIKV